VRSMAGLRNITIVLILATTSCTTWYQLRKDQLPPIAMAFETRKAVELEVPGESGEVMVRVDPDDRFRFESAGDELHSGRLADLRLDEETLRLVPGYVSKELRMTGRTKAYPIRVPLAEVDVGSTGLHEPEHPRSPSSVLEAGWPPTARPAATSEVHRDRRLGPEPPKSRSSAELGCETKSNPSCHADLRTAPCRLLGP
jgi:hypothetical protein